MKLLIVSDTHDNLTKLERLISSPDFTSSDVIIHLGDFVSPFTLKTIVETGKDVVGVFGNNDGDRAKMKEILPSLEDQPILKVFRGVRFVMFHGFKSPEITEEVITSFAKGSGMKGVVLYGHTHKFRLARIGSSLVLNPGTLSGYLANKSTYGVIELTDSKLAGAIKDLASGETLKRLELHSSS